MTSFLNQAIASLHQADHEEARALIDRYSVKSIERLRALVADGDLTPRERAFAAWIAASLGDRDSSGAICRLLRSEDSGERSMAARCFARMPEPTAETTLIDALQAELEISVQAELVAALGQTGGQRAHQVLLECAASPTRDSTVVAEALEQLSYFPSNDSREVILRFLSSDVPELRFWATFAIGQIGDSRDIRVLESLLRDESAIPGFGPVSQEAREAIEKIRLRDEL
jgi:HEAT repeat protein